MKKLLLLVVLAVAYSTAGAQLVTTSSYTEKKSARKTIWMLRAGLTSAGLSGEDADGAKSIAGYNASIEFNRAFATNFYWGSGLVFGNKGFKYSDDEKFTVAKLELPLNFGYKYGLTDDIKLDGHVGAYVGYDLFGTLKEGDDSYDLADVEDYNQLGYGLQFGVGVWYKKFNFNITYQKGLAKQQENSSGGDNFKAFENNWMFSLGYAF